MITSDEIAARIAFANQNIQPMQGAHSYGFGPPGSSPWRADSGTLGLTPWGPGFGDQVGSGFVRGMGSAAKLAGTVGTIGAAANWAGVGPSWLHATRYGAGFGMGLAPGLAIGMGIPMALGAAAHGAQQQSLTNNTLMQNFGNRLDMGGRGGFGMNRGAMQQVGNLTREIAGIPEMMTSVGELNRVFERMGDMQMLKGIRDISEFKTKFASTVKQLRDVSKLIGSTMEEALPLINEARLSGIFTAKGQMGSAVVRQAAAMVGMGASQQTLGAVQFGGAQLGQQVGGSRGVGAMGALNMFQTMSVAQSMGKLSEEQLSDITGQTGEGGIAALSQMVQGHLAVSMKETGLGKMMSAAVGEVKNGKYTGRVDAGLAKMIKNGQLNKDDLIKLGQDKLSAKGGLASFERNKNTLAFNASNEVGFEGLVNQIQELMKEGTKDDEDIIAIVAKQFLGGDQKLADTVMNLAKDMSQIERKKKAQQKKALEVKLQQAVYKDKYTIGGQWDRVKNITRTIVKDPFDQMGADIMHTAGNWGEGMVDSLLGRAPNVTLDESGARQMRSQIFNLAGSESGREEFNSSVLGQGLSPEKQRDIREANLAAAGKTTGSLGQDQKNLIDKMSGLIDAPELQKDLRASEGTDARIGTMIKHLESKSWKTLSALRDSGMSDMQIASAVQEKMGTTSENKSFVDFKKGINSQYEDIAVMSAKDTKALIGDIFHTGQFAFMRSVGSALGGKAEFADSDLQAIMEEGGGGKDVFLQLATDGKISVQGRSMSTQEFVDASETKLEKIAEEHGTSVKDLVALQKSLDRKDTKDAIKDQAANLKKLKAQSYLGKKAMAMDQIKDVSTALKDAKATGVYSDDITKLQKGLESITNNDIAGGSKQSKEAIKSLAERLRSTKDPKARDKIKSDLVSAGVPEAVIDSIEEESSWLNKSSDILGDGKDVGINDFLDKLGVSPEQRSKAKQSLIDAGAIDKDDTITGKEAQSALDYWSQDSSLSKILGTKETGGLLAADKEKVKNDAERLMIEANIKFVQAVTDAVGGDKLKESSEKLQNIVNGSKDG